MLARVALLVAALAIGLGATACGGDADEAADETTEETTTTETGAGDATAGREVFVQNCGSCHTLADAGTSGSIGPNLDEGSRSVEDVEEQVRNGGGQMPAFEGDLSDEEIRSVAAYVAEAGGG